MQPPIYLDYNATSPLLPRVREAMEEVAHLPLNASSVHYYGRRAKQLLEDSRRRLAVVLSIWPEEVAFTGSATEANNMALTGFPAMRLAVAATEHSSVLAVAKRRADAIILPVDTNGLLRMEALDAALREHGPLLVSVMLANNETGVIQPVAEIARRVKAAGGLMHCDAVQAFGKLPLDFNLLGVDMLTVSAHKAGGPVGVGVLVIRNGLLPEPLLLGGGQEKRRRAGTENISAIVGFGALAEHLPNLEHLKAWRDRMETAMNTRILGQSADRLPNTICAVTPSIGSETQLIHFDLAGICVSAGSACSSGRIEPSHVLEAMDLTREEAGCALRISMGWGTTETEVQRLLTAWHEMQKRLGKNAA